MPISINITINAVEDPRLPGTGHMGLDIQVRIEPNANDPEFSNKVCTREAEVAALMMQQLKLILAENDEANDKFYGIAKTHQVLSRIMPDHQQVKFMGALIKFNQLTNYSKAVYTDDGFLDMNNADSTPVIKHMQQLARDSGFYHKINWDVPKGTKNEDGECICPACQVRRELEHVAMNVGMVQPK